MSRNRTALAPAAWGCQNPAFPPQSGLLFDRGWGS